MSYYIDIIDTKSPLDNLVLESASAGGIVLEWNGGDTKDGLVIVSSQLSFDMLDKTAQDAAFIQYYTGNETRFKVQVRNNADDAIIWQGFILPDLYSEPYKNGNLFVNFVAVDGLSRLKGKYLSDDFYAREKSLIAIYSEILRLTGLELDLYFAPAIENFVNKDWNAIYIDGETFLDSNKKKDAYFILETLLSDTLCLCYQADNRWYIEGVNMRHVRAMTYKKYDSSGVFAGAVKYARVLKNITALVTPNVTIIPPYNEIAVTHKKTEPSLPKTLSKEVNDGWAIVTGVVGKIHANDWMANGGFYVYCERPDYDCVVYNKYYFTHSLTATYPQDNSQWVSLREKLFFTKSQKVKFEFEFKIKKFNADTPNPVNMDLWKNPFKYEIVFNDVVIYSNFNGTVSDPENVIFDDSGQAKIGIEHIFSGEGLFDIKIYGPPGKVFDTKILGIQVVKAEIQILDFQDEEVVTDVINDDFTVDKEVELTYADDVSGFSKGFRLYKLKEQTLFCNEIEVPIFYSFSLDGKNYNVVQLLGANLIKQNPYAVYKDGVLVSILNVFYNFNDGEQMVVETELAQTSGSFTVKKYAIDSILDNRTNWTQWTDAVYKIENTLYAKTVANIYRRLFNEAHEKFDSSVLNAIKFNDLIAFSYVYPKNFYVLNCSWNLDENKSNITVGRSHYKDSSSIVPGDDNIPPIVLACDDIYLTDLQNAATLTASAYDPDGFIVSQKWTKLVGNPGDFIDNAFVLNTNLENLTDDYYTYQIEVTDNDGAVAVDTVNVIRNKEYLLSLDVVSDTGSEAWNEVSRVIKYKLNISPDLLDGFVLKLSGYFELSELTDGSVGDYGGSGYRIEKNGVVIETIVEGQGVYTYRFELNVIKTDVIYIYMSALAGHGDIGVSGSVSAKISVNEAVLTKGAGVVTGVPLVKTVSVNIT